MLPFGRPKGLVFFPSGMSLPCSASAQVPRLAGPFIHLPFFNPCSLYKKKTTQENLYSLKIHIFYRKLSFNKISTRIYYFVYIYVIIKKSHILNIFSR